jgi:hypothetical protein
MMTFGLAQQPGPNGIVLTCLYLEKGWQRDTCPIKDVCQRLLRALQTP